MESIEGKSIVGVPLYMEQRFYEKNSFGHVGDKIAASTNIRRMEKTAL